jgi:hypothetical protein
MPNRVIRSVFDTWELLFHKAFRLEEIEPGTQHLFYIASRRYMGRPFTVDGVEVKRGDRVIELHINNDMVENTLRADDNIVRAMVQLIRSARQSMPALVKAIQRDKYEKSQALYGITFIHRGIERFGMNTREIPDGLSKRLIRWHLKNVLRMLNPEGEHIISDHSHILEPKLVVASKYRMIELFSSEQEPAKETTTPDMAASLGLNSLQS